MNRRRRPSDQPFWTALPFVCFLSCFYVGLSFSPSLPRLVSPEIDVQRSWIPLRASSGGNDPSADGMAASSLIVADPDDDEVAEQISLARSRLQPYFDFPLDDWQLQAGGAICQGHNVIVCAPTGVRTM
jgi:hypothetical protein